MLDNNSIILKPGLNIFKPSPSLSNAGKLFGLFPHYM